jgi:hypothetical protein
MLSPVPSMYDAEESVWEGYWISFVPEILIKILCITTIHSKQGSVEQT